jgi:acyl homoserine lactone synthase
MMFLFHGHQKPNYNSIFVKMCLLRAKVFSDRLNWRVSVKDGLEVDEFDSLDPLYAVYLSEEKEVLGTFRLLPSTGQTMLRDVFPRCLPRALDIRSPIVWESTRFCVDTERVSKRGHNGLAEVTGALLSSLIEIGTIVGLSHIVTVIDVRMERILRRAGCPIERLGDPVDYGGVSTLAILMECSEEWVKSIQSVNRLNGPQIGREAMQRLMAA